MQKAKVIYLIYIGVYLGLAPLARSGCGSPDLAAHVSKFHILPQSRISALLRFGEAHNLCFGIEYVDKALLTNPVDVSTNAGTVGEAIKLILGKEQPFSIEVREGVIEIAKTESSPKINSIFDYVLPAFEAPQGSIQTISNLLHMDLVSELNPQITGFAGHYHSGDIKDHVGPFNEYNHSLRHLLNAIVTQSKGGAWISRLGWKLRGDCKIVEKRIIWTFIEYGVPNTGYAELLENIASTLEMDSNLATSNPIAASWGQGDGGSQMKGCLPLEIAFDGPCSCEVAVRDLLELRRTW